MPYKSAAQRGFFHANVGKKGITQKVVNEFDAASKGMKLPQHVALASSRRKTAGKRLSKPHIPRMGGSPTPMTKGTY